MFRKNVWRILLLVAIFASSFIYAVSAKALGTPRITSVNPPSGSPVGSNVCIRAEVNWDSDFRSMRIRFGNEGWNESAEVNFERCFGTGHLGAGWYRIRVEVAKVNENWDSATWTEADYELTSQQQPTAEPTNPPNPSCSVNSFDVWPQSANIGDDINITGSGSCNTGIRAIKVKVDGNDLYEIGSTSLNTTWHTGNASAGNHTVRLMIAGQGDNDWNYAASQSITIQLNANVPDQPTSVPSSPFNNSDVININGDIYIISVSGGQVERHWVPNPDTLDALGIPRSWINNRGLSNSELKAIHRGSDIPDVNRDYQGFINFKNRYFPNTDPISPNPTQPKSGGNNPTAVPNVPTGPDGRCPTLSSRLKPGDIAVVVRTDLNLRSSPDASTGDNVLRVIPKGTKVTVISGPICNQGARWYEIGFSGYDGWVAEANSGGYHLMPNSQPAPTNTQKQEVQPTETPRPSEVPSQQSPVSGQDQGPTNSESEPTIKPTTDPWCLIPGFCIGAAPRPMFTDKGQCTYYVADRCPFVLDWLSQNADAYRWVEMAQSQRAKDLNVTVGSIPTVGAIVVWDRGCKDPNSNWSANPNSGHVALVTSVFNNQTFSVDESNVDNRKQPGHRDNLGTSSCVHFIYVPTCEALANLKPVISVPRPPQPVDVCSKYSGFRWILCKLGWH